MQDTLLTKCPHCATTFRLTQTQLDVAGGAVRCGACYQVFHAAEHIVKTAVVEERRTITQAPDPIEEAFDMKSDEGMDPYDTKDLPMDNDDTFDEDYRASMDREATLIDYGYQEKKSRKNEDVDESWAEELLREMGEDDEGEESGEEDDDKTLIQDAEDDKPAIISAEDAFSLDVEEEKPSTKKRKPEKGNELSDTFKNLGNFSEDDPFAINEIDEEDSDYGERGNNVDESWAKAMLDELEEEEAPVKSHFPANLALLSDEEPEDNSPFAARDLSRNKEEMSERARREKQKQQSLERGTRKKQKSELRNDETEDFFKLFDEEPDTAASAETIVELNDLSQMEEPEPDFNPESLFAESNETLNRPVDLSSQYGRDHTITNTYRGVFTPLACLLLVILLGAQYVYFQFDDLSRNPSLRPTLQSLCNNLGCELPGQQDISRIVGTNLVVRSHPYERNALVIDVILKNQANFEQPYPVVQLNFEDLEGKPVASRRFAPEEYIGDKTLSLSKMPRNTPIHLTLEIEDPGRNAVNYQLLFLPKNSAG